VFKQPPTQKRPNCGFSPLRARTPQSPTPLLPGNSGCNLHIFLCPFPESMVFLKRRLCGGLPFEPSGEKVGGGFFFFLLRVSPFLGYLFFFFFSSIDWLSVRPSAAGSYPPPPVVSRCPLFPRIIPFSQPTFPRCGGAFFPRFNFRVCLCDSIQ